MRDTSAEALNFSSAMDTNLAMSQLTLTSPPDNVKSAKGLDFMDLPTEIRLQIYEELVVVGKVFYIPDKRRPMNRDRFAGDMSDYERYRKPALQVFGISKQIYEAEEVYLSK